MSPVIDPPSARCAPVWPFESQTSRSKNFGSPIALASMMIDLVVYC